MRRRRFAQMLLLAMTMMVAMILVVGPAIAADSESDESTEETMGDEDHAGGFGTNTADAVIVAAVAGLLLGAFAFSQSDPGGIERATDDH